MSLKSKIEAVIYAAEEPVTLAQLASIFGAEVLAGADGTAGAIDAVVETGIETDPEAGPETGSGQLSSLEAGAVAMGERATVEAGISAGMGMDMPLAEIGGAFFGDAGTPEAAAPDAGPTEKREARSRERAVRESLRQIVAGLIEEYATGDRGMEIREIAGGYRVATKPEYHDAVRAFVKSLKPPLKLSLQALETLAVIAYKQPVTAPEVSEIRGVDSGGVLGGLMGRKLITTAGRKQVIGRPILYKTTKEFLLRFGLKDVNELPSIEEFEKMAGEIELEDPVDEPAAGEAMTGDLPFDGAGDAPGADALDASVDDALEANAGEAGVAVTTPIHTRTAEQAPVTLHPEGGPVAIGLDSQGGSAGTSAQGESPVELASEQSAGVKLEDA